MTTRFSVHVISTIVAAVATTAAYPARAAETLPSGGAPDRATLLEGAVESASMHEERTPGPTAVIVIGSLGVVTFGIVTALPPFEAADVIALGSSGFVVAGGVVAAVSHEDYRKPIGGVALLGGLGGLALASATVPGRFMQESGSIAIAAGSFSTAALVAIGAAAHRRPVARLRTDREELAANAEGRPIAPNDLRRIEGDLREMDPVVPDWITYSPLLIGGAVAAAPAIVHGFSDRAESGGAAAGAITMVIGGISMIHESYYADYRDRLRRYGLRDVALGPGPGNRGGLSLSGSFY